MSIDLSQFHQVFFEESFDGLDIMEQGLLELTPENPDKEEINSIFRAAHSIKGGSATFHFTEIAEFTHVLETLLDEMRNEEREVTTPAVDLMLKSVDVLRVMLTKLQQNEPIERNDFEEIENELKCLISGEAIPESKENATTSSKSQLVSENQMEAADSAGGVWVVQFVPEAYIVKTGNEPIRMFRELSALGDFQAHLIDKNIPDLISLEEDSCLMSWVLILRGVDDKEAIKEVFEWVEDDCELHIDKVADDQVSSVVEDLLANGHRSLQEAEIHNFNNAPTKGSLASSEETGAVSEKINPVAAGREVLNPKKDEPKTEAKAAPSGGGSIRVGIDKVDSLINLVGELVITQSMLGQLGEEFAASKIERLKEGLMQLEQNTRELQESVMKIRMLPISFVFNRFPRLVRDLSSQLGKKVELVISGESTELDKTVMEQIGDPMVHLVRNSMDHGVETPEQRASAGKPEVGQVQLNAFHQGGNIVIESMDDGAGINRDKVLQKAIDKGIVSPDQELQDQDIYQLIFEPGFSTADQISDVSGRGVGMDVVKRNIFALGGTVEVTSEQGKGSKFTIRLPLTLAILDGQLIRVANQIYVVPLTSIVESLQMKSKDVLSMAGGMDIYKLREDHVPIIKLYDSFEIEPENTDYHDSILVVVELGGKKIGFMVDELLAQQQVVIKSLETNFISVEGISGATILGDGKVALILDIAGMMKRLVREPKNVKGRAA